MGRDQKPEYKRYTMDNGVEIEVPARTQDKVDMKQQQSYQNFINVLSNIITKYSVDDE